MTDPYRPKHAARLTDPDPVLPIARLRRLGASEVFISILEEDWTHYGESERRQMVERLTGASDAELQMVVEFAEEEIFEDVDEQRRPTRVPQGRADLIADPRGEQVIVPQAPMSDVLDWIGDDVERAKAALEFEERKGKQQRKTLVKLLRAFLAKK